MEDLGEGIFGSRSLLGIALESCLGHEAYPSLSSRDLVMILLAITKGTPHISYCHDPHLSAISVVLTWKDSYRRGMPSNGQRLDGSQQTFPKLLRKASYETGFFGKWYLKSVPTGVDDWIVLPGQGQ